MIAHLGCSYVIVGHSERRKYHPEGPDGFVCDDEFGCLFVGKVTRHIMHLPHGEVEFDAFAAFFEAELITEPDVDGFLIGGAALDVDELTRVCTLTLATTYSHK